MVECLLCKQDVAGPNPTTSTSAGLGTFSGSLKTEVMNKENCNVTR